MLYAILFNKDESSIGEVNLCNGRTLVPEIEDSLKLKVKEIKTVLMKFR